MGVFHILALLASAIPSRTFGARITAGRFAYDRQAVAYAAALALIATFGAYVIVFARAVIEFRPAAVLATMPIAFLNVRAGEVASASRADELLWIALGESLALGLFLTHFGALGSRSQRFLGAGVALALAATALATHIADSPDAYLYVGLATLGTRAYTPPPVPFPGDLSVVNSIWGTPMLASAYGPVWIAISALLLAPLGTLAAKLLALRLLGLGSVAACAVLAHKLGASRSVVAGIACNPALYLAYVADAHNDLLAVDFVLAAMLGARRHPALGLVFALAASLIKLTLAPAAVIAAAGFESVRSRLAFAGALALSVATVYLADGAILAALLKAAAAYGRQTSPIDKGFRAILVLIALASSALIVARGRVRRQTAWAFPAFGDFPLPQYLIWGLPLVVMSPAVGGVFLVILPLLAFLQCPVLPVTAVFNAVSATLVIVAIVTVAIFLRPRDLAAPTTQGASPSRYDKYG